MEEQMSFMDELFTLPAYSDDEQQQKLYLNALQEEKKPKPSLKK